MKSRTMMALVCAVALSGCGAFVEVVKVDESNALAARAVKVLSREQLQGRHVEMVQTISATSCKNKLYDPDPTRENAIEQLQVKAARIGANTVTNLFCRAEPSMNLATNCWSAVVCEAAAARVE